MFYRYSRLWGYIGIRQMQRNPIRKGKTVTSKRSIHVIWDFPMKFFNIGRKKIAKKLRERAQSEERWLNG